MASQNWKQSANTKRDLSSKAPRQQQQSSRCPGPMVLEQLRLTEEVLEFEQFEELCKLYAIEAPYISKTQIEHMFDVYDGRKLKQNPMQDDENGQQANSNDDDLEAFGSVAVVPSNFNHKPSINVQTDDSRPSRVSLASASRKISSQSQHFSKANRATSSWCKLMFNKRKSQHLITSCLTKSETQHDFYTITPSNSNLFNLNEDAAIISSFINEEPETNDDDTMREDLRELKSEALQLICPLYNELRRKSSANLLTEMECQSFHSQLNQQVNSQQVLLDIGSNELNSVSICLLDKRRRLVKNEAQNGRRWIEFQNRFEELLKKLKATSDSSELQTRIDNFMASSKNYQSLVQSRTKFSERLAKEQLEGVINLTKNSLNHLIDAQLLLRNKLSSEQQQQNQLTTMAGPTSNTSSSSNLFQLIKGGNEYENLLRNNFNLLKIWQNLEETKRFACFICEPIKATLADLFYFSRQVPFGQGHDNFLLTSPLASLDFIQVKIGLLQILEALHYLHAICKLIHRNLNPKNILVAANDNWKLAGLEFAIRFESATISESASIMAHEGAGSLLKFSSSALAHQPLRRQRTLHQTKCDEIVKKPKAGVPQPELGYLAPELYRSAKCSHKSDIFSYGLILAQTYDLRRHKPLLNCPASNRRRKGNSPPTYEDELKKLKDNGAKKRSVRSIPLEFRSILIEMLDLEPNFRPSANYALQILRRPIELCKLNEDSLRHLKSSLAYLDTGLGQTANINNLNCAAAGSGPVNNRKRKINYFKKVTLLANRSPKQKQTRSLHLLNLLCRGLDSLVGQQQQHHQQHSGNNNTLSIQQQGDQKNLFSLLKIQFEQTFECLKQLFRLASSPVPTANNNAGAVANPTSFACPDSRTLMLTIVLHRRLLDCLNRMRLELPPISRLTINSQSCLSNRLTQNHKLLADYEDKLMCLVSRQTMLKLIPLLTDPLLKLDEFILIYELVNDLLAFVGSRSRQSYIQRGKHLLNELTPVTGCPSLSSTDDDDDDYDASDLADQDPLVNVNNDYSSDNQLMSCNNNNNNSSGSNRNLASYRDSTASASAAAAATIGNKMSGQRFNEYDDPLHRIISSGGSKQQQQQQQKGAGNNSNRLVNLPSTKISITAPSPMGSMREVNRASADSQQLIYGHRNSYQDGTSYQNQLIEQTSELSLNSLQDDQYSSSNNNDNNRLDDDNLSNNNDDNNSNQPNSKSRSQLIDELLKTINDDSFNDFVDFNNKYAATSQQQRPKSAIDGTAQTSGANRFSSTNQSAGNTNYNRPNSLALGGQNQSTQNQNLSANQQHRNSATPSTFDNMFRRMSTNLVQNFNKIGATLDQSMASNSSTIIINDNNNNSSSYNNNANNLRREKSSNTCNANNLYVDNSQVPARRHSDNTINIPRIQVALSSPSASHSSRTNLNQRASVSASKLANKWKLNAKTNQREASDKLSPNLGGALGYMRRHSSGNTTGNDSSHPQSNGTSATSTTANLLLNASPFKTKSSSNLGLDFLLSNRSMKRRYSAASMLGHQTQRKAEDLIDAGMKSVQNMFS